MTTREEDVYKMAFTQATEMANERPLPAWQPLETDDDHSEAPPVSMIHEHTARRSAVAATAAPGARRGPRTQWLAAASIALVLVLGVAGLVTRFAPSSSVADTPTPNVSQSPSAKPSSSPSDVKTLPSEQSPCFNMPAFREYGALPSDVNRIWVCGEGYDDKPLEGEAATALMAKINAVGSPTASDDGLGTCHEPDVQTIQVFFDSAGQHHGYVVKGTSCGLLGNVSAKAAVPLIMDAMKSAHGAPTARAGTTDDLCAMTNLRYGWFDTSKLVTKAEVCTDRGSVPLDAGRVVPDPAMSQIVRQTLVAGQTCSSGIGRDPEAAPTVNDPVPAIAIRITNGEHTAVWYLVDEWLVMGRYLQPPCVWKADSTTVQQLRDIATPDQPKTTYKAEKSTPVPANTSPCAVSPALDNGKDFPETSDRIWLCASGWDTRPLVGADAAAVLERIKAKKLKKAPAENECVSFTDFAVPVYFDSGSERVGYYLAPFCQPVSLVPTSVIYDEITDALVKVNGGPDLPKVPSDLCASTDAETMRIDSRVSIPGFVKLAAVCSDSTGKPLAQGRPVKVEEDTWENLPAAKNTSAPDHSAWITVRVSDGYGRVETMYLIGDQLWGGGGILAVTPGAKTLAEIRKLAGQS